MAPTSGPITCPIVMPDWIAATWRRTSRGFSERPALTKADVDERPRERAVEHGERQDLPLVKSRRAHRTTVPPQCWPVDVGRDAPSDDRRAPGAASHDFAL